ncbi:MAG TPA: YigZ family protein [Oscillospiraceae bacterium]|nr:YigZ family protein [Oscillospiraceae bacterium]
MLTRRLVPAMPGEYFFTEKRSRFIGRLWPAGSEKEAQEYLRAMRAKHYDATHNCWCYRISDPGAMRYGDDGEPQGTAGLPMLEVFRREEISDFCCVVTRYFGGVLLGAGGLVRAYSRAAKGALDASGVSALERRLEASLACPYPLLGEVRRELGLCGGTEENAQYGADVCLSFLIPDESADAFARRVTELSAGRAAVRFTGERFAPVPLREAIR